MNLPNLLTIGRIILVPIFMIALLIDTTVGHYLAALVFVVASFTDFLDGYLARKNNQITNFGKIMDPLADKLLVSAALICLVELGDAPAWIVVLILGREFAVTGLRTLAANDGIVVAASMLGKYKTVTQMIALVLLILKAQVVAFCGYNLGIIFLYVALFLTLYSGYDYFVKLSKQISWS